jgi:hypothetical protein
MKAQSYIRLLTLLNLRNVLYSSIFREIPAIKCHGSACGYLFFASDLDIAFRTEKRLPFVSGAEIRMWAASDEMHRSATILAGWSVVRTKVAGLLFGRQRHPQIVHPVRLSRSGLRLIQIKPTKIIGPRNDSLSAPARSLINHRFFIMRRMRCSNSLHCK